jgi:hypothetical protein
MRILILCYFNKHKYLWVKLFKFSKQVKKKVEQWYKNQNHLPKQYFNKKVVKRSVTIKKTQKYKHINRCDNC